jgi:hypothetical protein
MLKALVITPNDKTSEFGSLLAVARAEARRRERSQQNPPIRALVFVAQLQLYCAIYETQEIQAKKDPTPEKSLLRGMDL